MPGNYCKPILSPVRASFQQPSAVRPWPDELLRLPKHHQLQAAVCRPPRYWLDELRRPPKHSRQGSAAETMSAQTRPNSRQLMTRLPPRCRTSIIQSSALVQASFSLSIVALAARPRTSYPTNFYFGHFSREFFFPARIFMCDWE